MSDGVGDDKGRDNRIKSCHGVEEHDAFPPAVDLLPDKLLAYLVTSDPLYCTSNHQFKLAFHHDVTPQACLLT